MGRSGENGKNGKVVISGSLMGILLIVAGIVIAGNAMNWWHISIFFKGWWTLFIIIPCLGNVLRYGVRNTWGVGLLVGVGLLFSQWHILSFGKTIRLAIPVLLVLYGLRILGNGARFKHDTASDAVQAEGPRTSCNAFFSGNEMNVSGEEFFGASSLALFGGVELKLKDAIIVEDVTIDVTALFGGVDIFLPQDVNVKLVSTAIFGGVENQIKRAYVTEWPTVYIRATALFGGVEIK